MKKIFVILAGLALLSSCADEMNQYEADGIRVVAEACLPGDDAQTKVSLSEGTNASGKLKINVDWKQSGESFTVMTASSGSAEKFTQLGGNAFEGKLLTSWSAPYYAFYPAGTAVKATSVPYDFSSQKGTLNGTIPYMYALSYGGIKYNFNHLSALIKLTVKMPSGYAGTPSSVKVSSDRLKAKGTVDLTGSAPVFSSSVNTVTLPAQQAAQDNYVLYVYVNPMTASASSKNVINVTLSDASATYTGSLSTSVNIEAGKVYTASVDMSGSGDAPAVQKLASATDLFVEQISETQVRFSWNDNADGEVKYRIYKKEPNGEGEADDVLNTADIAAGSQIYTSGVVVGKVYDFGIQARASDAASHSEVKYYGNYKAMTWAEMQEFNADYHPETGKFTGIYRECGAPQNPKWTRNSSTSGTITWTCWSTAEIGFYVYVRKSSETAWKASHRLTTMAEVNATSYKVQNLTAGTTYVIGIQTAGTSEIRNSAIIEVGTVTMK